jgi:UDP-glucose 4-epimerase
MRAVVTGGAGFIGSNLVDALLERGYEVAVIDDLSTGRRENLEPARASGAVVHEVDIQDAGRVLDIFEAFRPGHVFHLAAQIDVRRSVADPSLDAAINISGTVNVLEAARRSEASRFIYSSTGGALYGEAAVVPSPESTPVRPLSPYGQSKYAAEGYCELYRRLHGLSTVTLRYANVYGPRQDPLGEGGVVAIFCGKARLGGRPAVFGDGRQTRDYTHVFDVVQANLLAATSDADGAYNIGWGQETSVLELRDAFEDLARGDFTPQFAPARPGEVFRSALDPSRARERLGWTPSIPLEKGLRQTLVSLSSAD